MSQATYSVYLADPFGVRLAVLDSWTSLVYSRAVNAPSLLTLEMPAAELDWRWLRRDLRLEVWRSLDGGPEYLDTETVWLLRGRRTWQTKQRTTMLQLRAKPAICLLDRRIIAAAAGSAQSQKTGAADNVLKAFVREQLGASAISVARRWDALLAVASDTGLAPTTYKAAAWRNLLKTLQEVALASTTSGTPLFFDVISPYAGALEFRTYVQTRGIDHSFSGIRPVVVSPERDNLVEPSIDEDWNDEATYIYAAGQGQDDLRLIVPASDTARIGASPFGRIERFVNASQAETSALLQQEANAALRDARPRRNFAGKLQDTEGTRYGRDWAWGDRIMAEYNGEQWTCRVDAIQVSVKDGRETISAALRAEDIG